MSARLTLRAQAPPWPDGWTLALCGLATLAVLASDWAYAHWLVADRARILQGELWRLLTGPLVAASTHELLADLVLLGLAGAGLGRGWSWRRGVLLGLALVLPPVAALLLMPSVTHFYGLSQTALLLAVIAAGSRVRGCRTGWDRRVGALLVAVAGLSGGVILWAALPRATHALNGSMVLAARRAGGVPYDLHTTLPRLTCGPRTLCWYAGRQLGRPCDAADVAPRLWSEGSGTHIRAVARELSARSGRPHEVARLEPKDLSCVSGCQPPILLVDVGWWTRKSHFIVLLEAGPAGARWYDVNRGYRRAPLSVLDPAWQAYGRRAVVTRRCLRRCVGAPGSPAVQQ